MTAKFRNILTLAAGALLLAPLPAAAQGGGALTSTIEVERLVPAGEGEAPGKRYSVPDVVVPGDRVRVTLTFANKGAAPASGINVTNPIADGLIFDGTSDPADFAVSVDGGTSFGTLAAATIPIAGAAPRPATAADVTHVRWLWTTPVPAGQSRSVAFFARVK